MNHDDDCHHDDDDDDSLNDDDRQNDDGHLEIFTMSTMMGTPHWGVNPKYEAQL